MLNTRSMCYCETPSPVPNRIDFQPQQSAKENRGESSHLFQQSFTAIYRAKPDREIKESQAHLPLAECTEQVLGGVLEVAAYAERQCTAHLAQLCGFEDCPKICSSVIVCVCHRNILFKAQIKPVLQNLLWFYIQLRSNACSLKKKKENNHYQKVKCFFSDIIF